MSTGQHMEDWSGFSSGGEDMASTKASHESAVIDMSQFDESSTNFDNDPDMHQRVQQADQSEDGKLGDEGGLTSGIGKVVADQMWQTGQQQARQVLSVYANIDILRPYFDVEPKMLITRLVRSFVPLRSLTVPQKVAAELYGPLMVVFTLVAILLMNMKSSGTVMQQGTLIGTSLGLCFGYWFGVSGLMYFLSYLCNTYISIVQCLSLLGYGLVGHCLILLLGNLTHYTHTMFYLLWFTLAGAATARIVTVLLSRTVGKSQRLLLCGTLAALHMLFLLYLHFAYHQIITSIINTLEEPINHNFPDASVKESHTKYTVKGS